ncbi:MAG: hypothetical protein ACL93V_10990 [Candidatus Electrothrix sp. YB6]
MIKELDELHKAGIQFSIHLFDGFYFLSPEEIIEYIKAPEIFESKKHGVSLSNWKKWKKHYENPCCHALTKKGKPCKGHVAQLQLHDFILKNCQVFCGIHENVGANMLAEQL